MRVGVCEDDAGIRAVLRQALTLAGHEVLLAHDGREALSRFDPNSGVDVVVMDIGLPDSDGRDVAVALRAAAQPAPVLFLTALTGVHHRIAGFRAGGDDYLGKPFDVRELVLRIEALARRASVAEPLPGGLRLDPTTHSLLTEVAEVHLTPTEYRVLAAIASRRGEVVRRAQVIAAAWSDGAAVSDNMLDSSIRRVRTRLCEAGAPARLETVRGLGYRLR